MVFACATLSVKAQETMTKDQKVSYAIGANFGSQVKNDDINLDMEAFTQGVRDGMAGQNKFTDQQMQEIFMQFQQDMQAKQANKANAAKAEGIRRSSNRIRITIQSHQTRRRPQTVRNQQGDR